MPEKQLKDYLHLYLGCQILNTGINQEYILKGYEKDSYKDKLILKRWIGSDPEDGEWSVIGNYISEEFKLVLRPLSDMTFNESINISSTTENGITWYTPISLVALCRLGFDLFGLIEAGLAIDKTQTHNCEDYEVCSKCLKELY